MKERIIVLKCWESKTYVSTNAPSDIIEEAIDYLSEAREKEDLGGLSDFDIVQKYVEDKQYTFEETEEDCEEYWW